jgi:hypothetical protein
VVIHLVISLTTLAYALAAYLKSKTNSQKLDENTSITRRVDTATNGKMDAVLAAVQSAASAAATAASAMQAHAAAQSVAAAKVIADDAAVRAAAPLVNQQESGK